MMASSKIYLRVNGYGDLGISKCVMIFTDTARYLINCCEETQRKLTERT